MAVSAPSPQLPGPLSAAARILGSDARADTVAGARCTLSNLPPPQPIPRIPVEGVTAH